MTRPGAGTDPGSEPPRAVIPADVDAQDKIVWGLTFRQLAILAAAAAVYGLWRLAARAGLSLPPAALLAAGRPVLATAAAVALGRRDGRPLDAWLASALAMRRVPRTQAPTGPAEPAAAGLARTIPQAPPLPAVLRLPADAISPAGLLHLPGGGPGRSGRSSTAAVVAAGMVNLGLRTPAEQAALLAGFARWLNSLTAPAQITVCAARVDLRPHAHALREAAPLLPDPALEEAAADHADFLEHLAATRDPLRRQVLVTVRADSTVLAARRGEDTARALAALGVETRVLDGPAVTAALTAAVDPYHPPAPGPRATPGATITTAGGRA